MPPCWWRARTASAAGAPSAPDIIEASWLTLQGACEYWLLHHSL